MSSQLQICRCTANGCANTPNGFRALHRSALIDHRTAEGNLQATLGHKVQSLTQTVTKALQEYTKKLDPCIPKFIPNLEPAVQIAFVPWVDLLQPANPANKDYLNYDSWRSKTTELLAQLTHHGTSMEEVRLLEQQLARHNATLQLKVVRHLEQIQQVKISTENVGHSDEGTCWDASPFPIEAEISLGIRRYSFPLNLAFNPGITTTKTLRCLDLVEGHPDNHDTVQQLSWIAAMSSRLKIGDNIGISSTRTQELLQGLTEHESSILNHVASLKFRSRRPTEHIVTIYKSASGSHQGLTFAHFHKAHTGRYCFFLPLR
jgi:hypothetical protein